LALGEDEVSETAIFSEQKESGRNLRILFSFELRKLVVALSDRIKFLLRQILQVQ